MKIFRNFSLLFLISIGLVLSPIAKAELKDEELDALDEEDIPLDDEPVVPLPEESDADEDGLKISSSPFVKTTIHFVQPESGELFAGKLVKVLIGFQNNGTKNFVINSIDGSFRYPQDYSYHIQNFSTLQFNKIIEPEREATFEYMFQPSETFSSRQFGLVIKINYKGSDNKAFSNAIFNSTITIMEPDEGMDGETFFLYIFLAAIVVLCLVIAQQFFSSITKKARRSGKSNYTSTASKLSSGSGSDNDIDYEFIPKENLQSINKSPRSSPRQRNSKKNVSTGQSSKDE